MRGRARGTQAKARQPLWPLSSCGCVSLIAAIIVALTAVSFGISLTLSDTGTSLAYEANRKSTELLHKPCMPIAPAALPPLNVSALSGEWNVDPDVALRSVLLAMPLLGCADTYHNENAAYQSRINSSLLYAVYLTSKNVTEDSAEAAFGAAKSSAIKKGAICSSSSPRDSMCRRAPRVQVNSDSVNPFSTFFLTNMDPLALEARARLQRTLAHGDAENTDHSHDIKDALAAFLYEHPDWNNKSQAYISLRENRKLERAMISRCQDSGTCYLIAPFLALHYAINLQAQKLNECTVDITEWLRKYVGADSLANFFFANGGAPTIEIVRKVFQPAPPTSHPEELLFAINPSRSSETSLADYTQLRSFLEKHGVGVIYHFAVYDEMKSKNASSFSGKHGPSEPEFHAMVLVGVRYDSESGQYFLLMQNSWKDLQFVEVRQDYAKYCDAGLVFVTTPQYEYPSSWPTVTFRSATTAVNAGVIERVQGDGFGF